MELYVTYLHRSYDGLGSWVTEKFESWDEEGSYTLLYKKLGEPVSVIVPTSNISRMKRVANDQLKNVMKTKVNK